MDAILANVFLKVQERLTTEVPQIKWIDQDLGQLEFYQQRPAVVLPCVLIDTDETDYSDEGQNGQLANCVLIVRIALAAYTDAASVRPLMYKEKALEYYNLEHVVNRALHGWCDSRYFSPLMRRRGYKEKRDDNLRVRVLRYEFGFRDSTTVPVVVQTIDRPELEIIPERPEA